MTRTGTSGAADAGTPRFHVAVTSFVAIEQVSACTPLKDTVQVLSPGSESMPDPVRVTEVASFLVAAEKDGSLMV